MATGNVPDQATPFKAGMVPTEHIAISFLAPGREGPVRATGTALRIGKYDGVAEVRVVDLGREERLMAVARVTVRILGQLRTREPTPKVG